jgi:hypothetical protein
MSGPERSADEIQREIERSRVELARTVDQLAYRTNPQRLVEDVKRTLKEKAQSPRGRIVIGTTGALLTVLIVRRIRKH